MKQIWKKSDLDSLLAIGLTENQATIYLTVLHRGLISATEISRFTGINRQQVYSDTEKLIGHGLLDITRKQRRKFVAADPRALSRFAERKISEAQESASGIIKNLPFLEELRSDNSSHKIAVKYFEGMKRLRDAYTQELDACHGTEVLSFVGLVEDLYQFFPESYWKNWNKRFVAQKNTSKMLVHDSKKARETAQYDSEYHRQSRHISPFPLKVNIDVFGDTVLVVSAYDELAIWINSAIAAESYRILFQTCWSFAKPF